MTSKDLAPYLADIVATLRKPWRATHPQCVGEDTALVGLDGGYVSVTVDSQHGEGRLVFETWLTEHLAPHQPPGTHRPVVTMARRRLPQAVGKDLRRRLVPAVYEFLDGARELAAQRHRAAQDLDSVLASVASRLGVQPKAGSSTVSVGSFGRPLFATAQVIQPLWRRGEHLVRFSIDAAPEHALVLAQLLGERVSATGSAADEPR